MKLAQRGLAKAEGGLTIAPEIQAALWQVKAEFLLAVDQKRWTDLVALFTDDARIDYSRTRRSWAAGTGPVYSNAIAFVRDVHAILTDAVTVHHATMPIMTRLADNRVKSIWRMEDVVVRPPGSALPQGHGFGLYDEQYRLTSNGWRIESLVFTRLLTLPLPVHS